MADVACPRLREWTFVDCFLDYLGWLKRSNLADYVAMTRCGLVLDAPREMQMMLDLFYSIF